MSTSSEPWNSESPEIIELELQGSPPKPAELLRQAPRVRFTLDSGNEPDDPGDGSDGSDAPPPARGEYRSGLLALLAYTVGPFAPPFLRQGRHNTTWTLLACLSGASWVALIWHWSDVARLLEQGIVPLTPGLLTMCCFTVIGVATWCRAIYLAGTDARFIPERLPPWLRRPVVLGLLGVVAPGLGHLASGHPRRAVCAFWIAATTTLTFLTLAWAGWLWRCNQSAGAGGLPGLALETVFLACATLAAVGVLLWIGSALDGVRLLSVRVRGRSELRGDWLAAALLMTILLLLATVQPVTLARQLDQFSGAMRFAGFRLIPLCFEASASQLDPAEPKYPMQIAELLESLGRKKPAKEIRERLRRRWDTYAEQLLREELHEGEELLPLPIDVGTDEADSTATSASETP